MDFTTPTRLSTQQNILLKRPGLIVVVAIPTLLALVYYTIFATSRYVSNVKFSVNVEQNNLGGLADGNILLPMVSQNSSIHESFVVKEYIHSQQLLNELRKSLDLTTLYQKAGFDFLWNISDDPSNEAYLSHFRNMVDIRLDEHAGIMHMHVRGYTGEDAEIIAQEILKLTEKFVNQLSNRVQQDAIAFARKELDNAETLLSKQNAKLAAFRNEHRNFDPKVAAETVVNIVATLEQELAQVKAEITHMQDFMRNNSPAIRSLKARASALQSEIDAQNSKLASSKGAPLADTAQKYSALETQAQFAIKRYEVALASLEAAQADARKKNTYLLRIEEPTRPQDATEPKRLTEILTIFFASLLLYLIGNAVLSSIKDHLRP